MYRVKQFLWAIMSTFKPIDSELINTYLNDDEKKIFLKLSKNEKHHSIRVCVDALKIAKEYNLLVDNNKLAKAALLHDVGKINSKLNVIEKSIIVLLDKFTKGEIKKYDNIKKIDTYYNHPKIGVKLLQEVKLKDREILNIVREHHEKNLKPGDNILLDIIIESDNKN